jgi:DNA-binding transcriptional ArsR family regulator
MDEDNSDQLNHIFHALSDPKRRAMLRHLAAGESSISELGAPFQDITFQGVSKHLKALESAGLVQRTVKGRTHIFKIQPETLAAVDEWLQFYERFWNNQFDALDAVLKAQDKQQAKTSQISHPGKP